MQKLTPMREQYIQIKQQLPECILFFRLGDFYEMFDEDARLVSKELDLMLTTRDRGKAEEDQTPMCGVPYHSSESYIARLVARGYKVAICEQMENPALAKGLVKREITRVITPGNLLESSMLDESKNNYFASACALQDGTWGVAFCDISTGVFCATAARGEDAEERIRSEFGRFHPAEALLLGEAKNSAALRDLLSEQLETCVDLDEEEQLDPDSCAALTEQQFGKSLSELGLQQEPAAVYAIGMLLKTLREAQKNELSHIQKLDFYLSGRYLALDPTARRNLELTETLRGKEKRGSLLWVLDKTKTAMGSRELRSWLEKPLLLPAEIVRRQNAIEELLTDSICREELSIMLRDVSDLERMMARIVTGTANCRDLAGLSSGLTRLPEIKMTLQQRKEGLWQELSQQLDDLADLKELIDAAVVDKPPFSVREGGMIRKGYSEELDRLRTIESGGRGMLAGIEAKERERSGISKLRVGYNRVFGYYIEVPNAFRDQVPDDWNRKQTLTNAERYINQELKELEHEILSAKDRIVELEFEIFTNLRTYLAEQSARVQMTSHAVAQADVLCCLAGVAAANHYTRPELDLSGNIDIVAGRHPVVEKMLHDQLFVPNDTHLGEGSGHVAIITGPNMAGKSTYMRQTALIVLMAQIGSFVPAERARIGIVDQIFTRIGASDDLASGQSTFMVEMSEVAAILKHATARSLLILDEIGRGTSTFDGMAIAQAVLEYAADRKKLGAKTMFATHYHELTALEDSEKGITNYNIVVKKRADEIVFLRKIVPGAADESLGVEVAKLAGVPDEVIRRARLLLRKLESGETEGKTTQKQPEQVPQLSMEDLSAAEIRSRLERVSLETLTPIEALNLLYSLKQLL